MKGVSNMSTIRNLDDLGRLPLPRELRRQLSFGDNEALEISIENDAMVIKKPARKDMANICAELVEELHCDIQTVSFVNGCTTVILKSGRIGTSKYNLLDKFDFNVAVAYALKNAGVSEAIYKLANT